MNTPDRLLRDYLRRLQKAAKVLPRDRRDELLEDITQHLEAAERAGEISDEAGLRQVLSRLGDPELIVAAEAASGGKPRGGGPGWVAVLTVTLLLIGGIVVPVFGWFAGVALLWSTSCWNWRDRLLGTLVWPGGLGGLVVAIGFAGVAGTGGTTTRVCGAQSMSRGGPVGPVVCHTVSSTAASGPPGWLIATLLILAVMAPIAVAVYLLRRASAQRASAAGQHRLITVSH